MEEEELGNLRFLLEQLVPSRSKEYMGRRKSEVLTEEEKKELREFLEEYKRSLEE